MKIGNAMSVSVILFLTHFSSLSVWGKDMSVKVKNINTDDDTSLIIRKGSRPELDLRPDFEMISESEEIVGEAKLSLLDSKSSWDTACDKWKQEIRELNRAHQIFALKCGSPSIQREANGTRIYQSIGTYKMRVRTKASLDGHEQAPDKTELSPPELAKPSPDETSE